MRLLFHILYGEKDKKMDNTERERAEKILLRYGDSIQIKDYGWALAATHNIIKQIESELNTKDKYYCECIFPDTDSKAMFPSCKRCGMTIFMNK